MVIKMSTYALINEETNIVYTNMLWDGKIWDGKSGMIIPEGYFTVILPENSPVSGGYLYKDGDFIAPAPPPLTDEEIQQEKEDVIAGNGLCKKYLLNEATQKVSILQDAVDLDMATDEESRLLPLWKKYRVLVNRVDTNTNDKITWPEKPV